jgi:branched-chain amino acid transport system permease protein
MTALEDRATDATDTTDAPQHGAEGRDFGPIRWVPRLFVLVPLAYFILVYVPGTTAYVAVATDACIYAIVGLSLNIIIGYTGQLSLGHQGFVGVGAFTAAYALTVQGVPFAVTFVLAGLLAGLFALVIGLVALRITGLYLALITLVFGLALETSLFEVPEFTNQGGGQPAVRPDWLFDDSRYYLFCLAFLVAVVYLDYRLLKSKVGRALLAIKENERVAEAFGINVTLYKLIAFTLSGTLAGIAGALLAFRIGIVTGSGFGFFLALTFVLMTVVGGLGDRLGVIIGSTIFAVLDFVLTETPVHVVEEFLFFTDSMRQFAPQFIGAFLLLLTLTLFPGGIAQQNKAYFDWLKGKRFNKHDLLHPGKESGPGSVEGSSVRA